jgi:hypothetical protein
MILKAAVYLLTAQFSCDPAPALAALFTPLHPLVGRYEACTTPESIEAAIASANAKGAQIEAVEALDAFGAAGPYNRFAVARLYGGTRAAVAHVWIQRGREFESQTFISPYPDPTLTRLIPGTLMIRLHLARGL